MSSQNDDLPYWVALARLNKLGPRSFALLQAAFPTMSQVWHARADELKQAGLPDKVVKALLTHRQQIDIADSWHEITKLNLEVITIKHHNYPTLLKQIYDPPPLLFSKGNLLALNNLCLAVVGSRRTTIYGLTMTKDLVAPLAAAGITIVSGLAYGIDAAAHEAALEGGGKTVAVMASGLDQIYPRANSRLAHKIIEAGGLWLSEFPPRTAPLKQNFPFRNRIIAGLSNGTLVIEAANRSGALLTAHQALEANREVLAVPGNATSPTAAGSNELIKQGAHLVTNATDVLTIFGLKPATNHIRQELQPAEKTLLEKLPYEPTPLETLVRNLNLSTAELTANLTLLEIKGYLKDEGGHLYRRLK